MASITLESILRAAWSLHLAGALPNMPGVYMHRIEEARGIRPWLDLALSDEDANELIAAGCQTWHMGALLGIDAGVRRFMPSDLAAPLSCPEAEAPLIRFVEGICSEFGTRVWSARHAEEDRARAYGDERVIGYLKAFDDAERNDPAAPTFIAIMRCMAADHGIDIDTVQPCDLSRWGTTTVDATLEWVSEFGGSKRPFYHGSARTADGRVLDVERLFGDDAFVGTRLRLHMAAVTPRHGGYVTRAENLRTIEEMQAIKAKFAAHETSLEPEPDLGFKLGDHVVLNCNCLEATKGTPGIVLEQLGDMLMVVFYDVPEPVPCYASALDLVRSSQAA